MSKQLRIWIFAFLGTLLASSSLFAEGVITLTTSKAVGEKIGLGIEAKGNVTIEGVQEAPRIDEFKRSYTLTSQTVVIRGDVTTLDCAFNKLDSLKLSGCTSLTTIHCQKNPLTSLDVSGSTALTELRCFQNELTLLDYA